MSFKDFFLRNFGVSTGLLLVCTLLFSVFATELRWVPFGAGLVIAAATVIGARAHWKKRR